MIKFAVFGKCLQTKVYASFNKQYQRITTG